MAPHRKLWIRLGAGFALGAALIDLLLPILVCLPGFVLHGRTRRALGAKTAARAGITVEEATRLAEGSGMPPELLRGLPAGLDEAEGKRPSPPMPLRGNTALHPILKGGKMSDEFIFAQDLWSAGGMLIVAVRRPGCWMCREQALAVSKVFSKVIASPDLPGMPKFVAVFRDKHIATGDDGATNEIDDFRDFFPGETFVDPYAMVFKALGDRQFVETVTSREASVWMMQRMFGMKSHPVSGNFHGGPDTALKFGGCMVIDRKGETKFVHQEGLGAINYDALASALRELAR
eukprot:TRINITY_DN76559_c0_g1_i1.p1 TRINITY_DN76559_c0_g1~~TRINITY_DN76559_c0_g1_i1.p1  ORF type:complete len:321 (-),score=48.44 TRINITY_DN76559_c0_g1_i1:16-885(-)